VKSRGLVLGLGLLAATCGALGCATLPACPAKGGPAWHELTSAHFRLRSDLEPKDAEETVRRLEELRASMLATIWPGAPAPTSRTEVVVLRSRIELLVFARDPHVPPLLWGVRSERPPLPATLVFAGTDYRTMGVLVHGLALDLSRWFMPMQPLWYSEGIATFLETLRYDRDAGLVDVGEPSAGRHLSSEGANRVSAARLLDARSEPTGEDLAHFEDSAWLLMHFLINKRSRDFARLQTDLVRLKPSAEAWASAMPDLPPEKLDAALDAYSRSGEYAAGGVALRVPAPTISVRVMSDAEVHATRALLFETAVDPGVAPDTDAAKREVAEALAADATNASALAIRFFWFTPKDQHAERGELARLASTAHPEDWLSWLMVATEANDAAAERTALSRALRVAPDQVLVLSGLAQLDAASGRWQESLSFSTKAMHLGERRWSLLELHVEALAHVGRCDDAAYFVEALKALSPPAVGEEAGRRWLALRPGCADAAVRAARDQSSAAASDASP
jgi:hypothetical protein